MEILFDDLDNNFETTLNGAITDVSTTINLTDVPGNTGKGWLTIDPDTEKMEHIYFNAKGAGFVSCPVSGGRGQGGTVAVDHDDGAVVRMYLMREHVKGLLDKVTEVETKNNTYIPTGHLINGKIVPSVASNNLTLAVKTLANNDPSTSDPVYCRIGDTIRSITSALSVTKNAGTNWMNAGSSELATKETDYFVYIGYNNTDGVTIGFSRIPYACRYGDFSTTTTNEKYCAISTITNATANDAYTNCGRFAATLGVSATYYWTVPTFTTTNLIQAPINQSRILSTNIILGASTTNPTIGNGTAYGNYQVIGNQCFCNWIWTFGSTSTAGSGYYKFLTPFSAAGFYCAGILSGLRNGVGRLISSLISNGNNYLSFEAMQSAAGFTSDPSHNAPYAWGNGDTFTGSAVIQI